MKKKISEWLKAGKSNAEIAEILLEDAEVKSLGLTAKAIGEAILEAKSTSDVMEFLAQKETEAKALEAKASKDLEFKAEVKKQVEEAVKGFETHPLLQKAAAIQLTDNWKEDAVTGLKLALRVGRKEASSADIDAYNDYRIKNINRWAEKMGIKAIDGIITGTDNAGGYFMPPEFDSEVDKNTFSSSALLSEVKIRTGSEKTEINSIGTFNLSFRTDENAAFGATKPTFAQQELKYKDAGAIVDIANRSLESSFYNIISELTELASDAKIRLLEPLLTTGSTNVDSDAFNGIRFHTGITTLNCLNYGGSGKVTCSDLTNLYLTAPSQTRAQGSFIMDSREAMLLAEERAQNGEYLEAVEMIDGQYVHKPTGKKIIIVDNMSRLCNGVTDRSTGTDVPVLFGVLPRFRIYQLGGFRIDLSKDFRFDYDATSMRFVLAVKFGIPTNSRSSFVTLQGVKYNLING